MTAGQQTTTHTGDKVAGDKVAGDKVAGDKFGDQNNVFKGVTFSGDVVINSGLQREQDYQEISLDDFRPPRYAPPVDIDTMVRITRDQHMIVLHGERAVVNTDTARQVGWQICTHISATGQAIQSKATRWKPNPDTESLTVKMRETKEQTVFILPNITLRDIRDNDVFLSIRDAAQDRKHFVIVSTDGDINWKPSKQTSSIWYQLQKTSLFAQNDLTAMLIARLEEAEQILPPGRINKPISSVTLLSTKYSVSEIATRIESPREVSEVVNRLAYQLRVAQSLSDDDIFQIISNVKRENAIDVDEQLRDIYARRLDSRSRLLALSLSFFSNMLEEQCFAAVEYLSHQIWRTRDPQLYMFDYADLENLQQLFDLDKSDNSQGSRIILPVLPNQRQRLLGLAWQRDRRQILAALPVLETLVKQSMQLHWGHFELYQTEYHRALLRDVLGETLSDIGLIAAHNVDMTLLKLAMDETIEVQAVSADAIARWRYFGHTEKLFNLLELWWNAAKEVKFTELLNAMLEGRPTQASAPHVYVRATVVLAIGFAALYDPPNDLADKLYKLLVDVARDSHWLVRNRLETYTLPVVTGRHLKQLRPALHDMAGAGLQQVVAVSIAGAYTVAPVEVRDTLIAWWRECDRLRPTASDRDPDVRENLLATVALTLGYIDYSKTKTLTSQQAINQLRQLLQHEGHAHVREAALKALTLLAEKDFAGIATLLHQTVSTVSDQERNIIVRSFRLLYVAQLQQLKGDDKVYVSSVNKHLPLWLPPSEPPLTPIEQTLMAWTKNARHPIAQQLALRALAAIEPIKRYLEGEAVRRAEQRKQGTEEQQEPEPAPEFDALRASSWYTGFLVPTLASMGVWQYEPIIWNTLPEVLAHHRDLNRRDNIESLLRRWSSLYDHEIVLIARRLRAALWMSNHGVTVMSVLILLVVGICFMLLQVVTLLTNRA